MIDVEPLETKPTEPEIGTCTATASWKEVNLVDETYKEVMNLKYEIQMLRESLTPVLAQLLVQEKCEVAPSSNESADPKLFIPIISLAKDGSISAKTASALDCAGIRYIADFAYITLDELSSLHGLKDNELSGLLQLLQERFNIYITNAKQIAAEFHVKDVVRFLPTSSSTLQSGQLLTIVSADYSSIIPRYSCATRDKNGHIYLLSPSVIERWTP